MTQFPNGFLWGASTAGHQVEGGNVNADLWPFEWADRSGLRRALGRRLRSLPPVPRGRGAAGGAGLNAYRFSLEWARIEPEPGFLSARTRPLRADDRELPPTRASHRSSRYNHFTVPRWVAGRGGWTRVRRAEALRGLRSAVTRHLGDLLSWVCTLNEPNLIAMLRQRPACSPWGRAIEPAARTRPVEEANRAAGVWRLRPGALPDGICRRRTSRRWSAAHRLAQRPSRRARR